MELIFVLWAVMAGLGIEDVRFDKMKGEECAEVQRYDSNSLQIDICYAKGKIERGQKDLEVAKKKVERLIK